MKLTPREDRRSQPTHRRIIVPSTTFRLILDNFSRFVMITAQEERSSLLSRSSAIPLTIVEEEASFQIGRKGRKEDPSPSPPPSPSDYSLGISRTLCRGVHLFARPSSSRSLLLSRPPSFLSSPLPLPAATVPPHRVSPLLSLFRPQTPLLLLARSKRGIARHHDTTQRCLCVVVHLPCTRVYAAYTARSTTNRSQHPPRSNVETSREFDPSSTSSRIIISIDQSPINSLLARPNSLRPIPSSPVFENSRVSSPRRVSSRSNA